MNALQEYLIKLIKTQGPMSIAAFMAESLGNDKHGYYMKQDPFGQDGDFTTAPEISQMFGEIIGLWQANNWLNMGRPETMHLIELGPGRGTLMQDALRAMKIVPGLLDAVKLHLVEMSPALRKIQKKNLQAYVKPVWYNRINEVLAAAGTNPVFIIANEFFDALPVRQFQKTETGWHERLVCLDSHEELCFQLAPMPTSEQVIPPAHHRAETGNIVEICAIGENILEEIASHIKMNDGTALIIDYGHDTHGTGDSLQAVKGHQYSDILTNPGDADLTTHVNFQRLKEIAQGIGIKTYGAITQGNFLQSMGIKARSDKLSLNATEAQKKDIHSALNRLTGEKEMGKLFKVMALTDHGLQGVIGFEA